MAKYLALDWDQREARFVVARPKGDSIVVDQAVAVPIELGAQQGNHDNLAEQLQQALLRASLPKCQALVAVGRSLIELDRLQLPPAPEEELPEMVRFQAMRDFASLQENSPLDFVPLGDAGNEPGEIIAAAISKDLSEEVISALSAQGQEPHRAGMRPFAVASLAMRIQPSTRKGVVLIIAQQSESAELVVAKHGTVVFTRSFRLPPDWVSSESGEPMLGEVRRTIAAAQNQLGSARVEKIVLFGTPEQHAGLCERIGERTKLDVELLSPFAKVAMDKLPDRPERFAGAIGMLLDEANEVAPVIDFLNPRRTPVPESPHRKKFFYGGCAAALILGLLAIVMWKYQQLDQELKSRTQVYAKLSKEIEDLESTVELAKELREWKQKDRNWLDELVHLSGIEGLTGDDFMIDQFSGDTRRDNRCEIQVQGKSKSLAARQKLQQGWRDQTHKVSPEMSSPIKNKKDGRFPKMFKARIWTEASIPIVRLDNLGAPAPPATEPKSNATAPSNEASPAPDSEAEEGLEVEAETLPNSESTAETAGGDSNGKIPSSEFTTEAA